MKCYNDDVFKKGINEKEVEVMKKAIIAMDGGGSNLRLVVVDSETEKELYSEEVNTGTNLTTVPNREEALENIRRLIKNGYAAIPKEYTIVGVALSSAGTEIADNVRDLNKALEEAVSNQEVKPELFITNDIDILLHSSDIALVAGTGTVAAVKYRDIKSYDNTDEIPEEVIDKLDGDGQFVGDKGSGYWIATEALTKVGQIEKTGYYINHEGKIVKADKHDCLLRKLVFEKLLTELGYSKEVIDKVNKTSLKQQGLPDYIAIVYGATTVNGREYDRAKVGSMFGAMVNEAAKYGDEVSNDILESASQELFKNIVAAYDIGGFDEPKTARPCNILLSGSVLTKSDVVRYNLMRKIKERYPYGVYVSVNKEKPVMSTVKYVKSKLEPKQKTVDAYDER